MLKKSRYHEEAVTCIDANLNKLTLKLVFQSVEDPGVFYSTQRDVLTKIVMRKSYIPDHPPVLILKLTNSGKVRDVYYGFKDTDSYRHRSPMKPLSAYKIPVVTYMGQVLTWVGFPLLLAVALFLILFYSGYLSSLIERYGSLLPFLSLLS